MLWLATLFERPCLQAGALHLREEFCTSGTYIRTDLHWRARCQMHAKDRKWTSWFNRLLSLLSLPSLLGSTPFTHLYSFIIILCCEVLKLQGFLSHDVYFWCCKFLPKSSDSTFRNISMLQMTRPKWIDGYCEAKVAPRLHAKCTLEVQ